MLAIMLTRRIPGALLALTLTTLTGLALTARPAQAQATQINDPSGLSAGDTTLTYTGTPGTFIPSYTDTAGGQAVTLTDTGNLFKFVQQGTDFGGAFPVGTNLLLTGDVNLLPRGPLTISFSSGVTEFGLSAQDSASDFDSFTFSAYDGASLLRTFNTATVDNTNAGTLSFLGASADSGSIITSVVVSSTSSVAGQNSRFAFGPLTFGPATATPEPASYAAFVLGGLGLLGLGIKARKRRSVA